MTCSRDILVGTKKIISLFRLDRVETGDNKGVILSTLKQTSFSYGRTYQAKQAEKYRNRNNNHWKKRIELAVNLVEKYVLPRLSSPKKKTVVVDVGCSIGTFAIEFSKMGYDSYGIDFDASALDIARQLSKEENTTPEFHCGDVSNWSQTFPPIDIAICFDIFEHLHDDELGAFLSALKKQLSWNGCLVFHTFPTEYDQIFYISSLINSLMIPFRFLSPRFFDRIVQCYSKMIDICLLAFTGKTYKQKIKTESHCNPLSRERLSDILNRAGFDLLFFGSSNLYKLDIPGHRLFDRQPIAHRNLYGVAVPDV